MTARDAQSTDNREMSDPLVRRCGQADFIVEYDPPTWHQRRDGLLMQGIP